MVLCGRRKTMRVHHQQVPPSGAGNKKAAPRDGFFKIDLA
jgi:hypothetical protein